MRIGNVEGRLALIEGESALDVQTASAGRFSSSPQAVFEQWEEFTQWARTQDVSAGAPFSPEQLGPPVPRPPQVFAIGLNYRDHAEEAGLEIPAEPMVFTKFPTSITGPAATVQMSSPRVDWEIELVAVIGRQGHGIAVESAWDHIAGLTCGQDISDRRVQFAAKPPQFSMGKSFPGYSPIGPVLVSPDEFTDPDALALGCAVDEETVQDGTTADMIFPLAELVSRLSQIVTLLPGDVIFTGTPAGVGSVRTPRRYLHEGEVLRSWIAGIGEMRTVFTA